MSKANRNRLTTNITQSCFIKYSSIYFLLSYSWIIWTEFFRAYYMDPVGHILEIFEIFGLGIGIGHSGRLYGSGPDYLHIVFFFSHLQMHNVNTVTANRYWISHGFSTILMFGSLSQCHPFFLVPLLHFLLSCIIYMLVFINSV